MIDGAFNVNSTSVLAWKAVLSSTLGVPFGASKQAPFPRQLDPVRRQAVTSGASLSDAPLAWSGFRALKEREIDALAKAIVEEVKHRGPFISLSDFVNRRLRQDSDSRLLGTLQAAIERAGLNRGFRDSGTDASPISSSNLLQEHKAPHKAAGAPAYLLQADLLTPLGPMLTARSDTFRIRAYGDSTNVETGKHEDRAWCEAVVERTTEPIHPDGTLLNPDKNRTVQFGRRFKVIRFRWLTRDEI